MQRDALSKAVDAMAKQLDRIISVVVSHGEKLETTASKEDIHRLEVRMTSGFDQQLVILQRLDHERISMTDWIRRIEGDVNRIKGRLKMA